MRALFDVNVLIAILDQDHVHHWRAHEWWAANRSAGWATCALTENGVARIVSQSGYKNRVSTIFATDLLAEQVAHTDHVFWHDDISLRDAAFFVPTRILGPNQITDVYLLALAVRNGGRLGTAKEMKLPPVAATRARLSADDIAFYDSVGAPDFRSCWRKNAPPIMATISITRSMAPMSCSRTRCRSRTRRCSWPAPQHAQSRPPGAWASA